MIKKIGTTSTALSPSGHGHSTAPVVGLRRSFGTGRWIKSIAAGSVPSSTIHVEPTLDAFPAAAPGRFIDDNTSFVQEFPVRGYEVSPNQRASMVTIANLLQAS